jgi:tripartite-type tricarboxylate transporter receptor subunit TctC
VGIFARTVIFAVVALAGATGAPLAADYPNAAVKVIVANTAGTSGDNLSRIVFARLSEMLGRQFYVINHAGAGGTIGAEIAARSPADGYTILSASNPLQVIAPHLYKNLKYKPQEDFEPLMMFARTENVLVVNPNFPAKSVGEVIDYGKKNPGKLKMANAGLGFQSHLSNVMFANMAGIDALHVAYKGQASMISVVAGETDMTIAPLPALIGMMRGGRVKPIAVTGTTRSSIVPELPTVAESGLPGFAANGWSGLFLPKGVPPDISKMLIAAIGKVLAEQPIQEQLRKAGGEPWVIAGEEMRAFVKQEYDRYGELIRAANIKLE